LNYMCHYFVSIGGIPAESEENISGWQRNKRYRRYPALLHGTSACYDFASFSS
jgi:hypothetical protein